MKPNVGKINKVETPIELSERNKLVLRAVVQLYITSAQPVGSRLVARYLGNRLKLSPASIRNILYELEEMDLLHQTHASSGRIPTDKGYRYFIDSLLVQRKPTEKEIRKIQEELNKIEPTNFDDILKTASKVLGVLSKYLSIVIVPEIQDITVEKIELIPITSNRLLFVLALNSNIIHTLTIDANIDVEEDQIEKVSQFVNEKISGKTLRFIYENFSDLFAVSEYQDSPIIKLIINIFDKIQENLQDYERTFIAGARNLLLYPEFQNPDHIKNMITILENTQTILNVINQFKKNNPNLTVLIGSETGNELLLDYSIIASPYWIRNATGYIGLLGPKRMNYPKVITLVELISNYLSQSFARIC
jgi:heat-inducible transcriptional repressor